MRLPRLSPQAKKRWRVEPIGIHPPRRKISSPRSGFFSPRRKTRPVKRLFIIVIILIILAGLGGIGVFLWIAKDLPSPDRLLEREIAQSTKIYDRTGKIILYEIHGAQRRTLVELDEISDWLIWATIVTEDKDFYQHKGFDLRGIIRAVWKNITRRGKLQGGSTITQQFIKNSILTPQKSYIRKIKELILAYQIERKFSKDQILKMYLNEIPYGANAYGAESAARIYFNKRAKDLTLAEATLLAALPKAPTYYSPHGSHRQELLARQEYILNSMVKEGYISQEKKKEALEENALANVVARREAILAPHFVMYVKELLTAKYGERLVEKGGLKVITTLDIELQELAEEIIEEQVKINQESFGATNAALVALDAQTGQILTMVGSRDYFDQNIDGNVNVTICPRQPGSSFKPIVYARALEEGYTPETIIFDVETNFGPSGPEKKDYIPHNYDGKTYGPITMRQALAGSINIASVKVIYLAGVQDALNLAERMGYTTLKDRSRFGLSLVLGGAEVKLLEHVSAFSVFAQEGIKRSTQAILSIEDSAGRVLEEIKPEEGTRIMNVQIARTINDILSDNEARAFVFGAQNFLTLGNRPVAAKTGTTNDFRDAWTIGYTPTLVAGVWTGNNDNTAMTGRAAGANVAAPVWNRFMRRALEGQPIEEFTPPGISQATKPVLAGWVGGQVKVKIDKVSGKLATEFTPEDCVVEKTFWPVHSILHSVNKADPQGPIPDDPTIDPQYTRWEEAVQKWAEEQEYITEEPPIEYDDVHLGDEELDYILWLNPRDETEISRANFPINLSVFVPAEFDNIARIKFFYSNIDNGESKLVATIFDPEETGKTTVSWAEPPPVGHYQLYIEAIDRDDQQIQSKRIEIEIE